MSKKEETQAAVNALAEVVRPLISFDDMNQPTLVDPKVFENNLPEGLTAEHVAKLGEYTKNFIVGATQALDVTIPKFVDDTNLEKMKLTIPMVGDDTMDFVIQRERESHIPGTGEKITKFGSVTVAVNHNHTGAGFKNARAALQQQFAEALGKNK